MSFLSIINITSTYQSVDPSMVMRCVQYVNGEGLHGRQWSFEPAFFHQPSFVANQFPKGGYVSFTLEVGPVIHAIVHLKKEANEWVSLPKSPFGGVGCAKEVSSDNLSTLIDTIVAASKGCKTTIYTPFEGYPSMAGQTTNQLLLTKGFVEEYSDLHQFLELESFFAKIHESQLRRLAKCKKAGFRFNEESHEHLGEIYRFLDSCRKVQSLKINMSFEALMQSVDNFKGVYRLFSVRDGRQLVAACITCRVSSDVLYYFLPGSDRSYNSFSPMVMLVSELCALAKNEGYNMIDLGKSSVHGVTQKGLSVFKARMGANPGERKCFVREF